MSNDKEEVFDYAEFKKRVPRANNTIEYHRSKGHIPKKTVYTQKDVDKFIETYLNKKTTEKQMNGAVPKSGPPYTKKQFAEEAGLTYKNFGNYLTRKVVPNKKLYNEFDLKKFKEYLVTGRHGKYAKLIKPTEKYKRAISQYTPPIEQDEVNPFEIVTGPVILTKNMSPLVKYLIDKMRELPVYTKENNQYIPLTRTVIESKKLADSIFNSAKKIISTYPGFENASWRIKSNVNVAKEFTHSQIIRQA